jgi:hypothetical protein
MPIAVALGLSDHPALLAGYGPIGADQARALLPQADLVRACVDATTGEVLAVEQPLRRKTWQTATTTALHRHRLRLRRRGRGHCRGRGRRCRHRPEPRTRPAGSAAPMATSTGTLPDLRTDGYIPSEALGRLVDLRDVTSCFPGDATAARRCDRDHRTPYPLGPTDESNLQNLSRRWHRAKHNGWTSHLDPDGTTHWTSPTNGVYTGSRNGPSHRRSPDRSTTRRPRLTQTVPRRAEQLWNSQSLAGLRKQETSVRQSRADGARRRLTATGVSPRAAARPHRNSSRTSSVVGCDWHVSTTPAASSSGSSA